MSASDHLSKSQFRLFHGTNVDIPKGEHIYPGDASENDEIDHESGKHVFDTPRSRWGEDLAFASTSLHDASQYGKNIYEVSGDKNDDKLEPYFRNAHTIRRQRTENQKWVSSKWAYSS